MNERKKFKRKKFKRKKECGKGKQKRGDKEIQTNERKKEINLKKNRKNE